MTSEVMSPHLLIKMNCAQDNISNTFYGVSVLLTSFRQGPSKPQTAHTNHRGVRVISQRGVLSEELQAGHLNTNHFYGHQTNIMKFSCYI